MKIQTDDVEFSEINLTPFIDIMLVLLIIFMVVTPIATSSIKVELPKSSQKIRTDINKPIIISIDLNGDIFVSSDKVKIQDLGAMLDLKTKNNKDVIIFFNIDKSVSYEKIISVVQVVKKAQYSNIAFSTKISEL